jgi:hypothetical protein
VNAEYETLWYAEDETGELVLGPRRSLEVLSNELMANSEDAPLERTYTMYPVLCCTVDGVTFELSRQVVTRLCNARHRTAKRLGE